MAECTVDEVYEILSVRQEVFVVEQKCFYQDCDGADAKAFHLRGYQENKLVAYLRAFPAGVKFPEQSIGRVLTAPSHRGLGVGKVLMNEGLVRAEKEFGRAPIRIAAQAHLEKFYREFSFAPEGKVFMEDGIPHLEMLRP